MKKWITCLFTVCLLAVALSVTAFAAEGITSDATKITSKNAGEVALARVDAQKVSATVKSAADKVEYLIVVTNTQLNASNPASSLATDAAGKIVYIDQQQGKGVDLPFTIYPIIEAGTKPYYVYMSSSAGQALKEVGSYEATGDDVLLGDVDGNGRITPNDASEALRIYVRLNENPTEAQRAAADTDKNGRITPNDASMILQKYVGLIENF